MSHTPEKDLKEFTHLNTIWKGTIKNKNGRTITPKEQGNSNLFQTCYDLFSWYSNSIWAVANWLIWTDWVRPISHSWCELLHEGYVAGSPCTWCCGSYTLSSESSPFYLHSSLSATIIDPSQWKKKKSPHPTLSSDLGYLRLCPSNLRYLTCKYMYVFVCSFLLPLLS